MFIGTIWQDFRYAARAVSRRPAFTAVAVLVLAFGIGLNTAVFSIINAVLFRPLPVRAPGELAYVYLQRPDTFGIGYRDYEFLRDHQDVFTAMCATQGDRAATGPGGQAEWSAGEAVTVDYFEALGVNALRGRVFVPAQDEASGAAPVVVISEGLWRRRFDADPAIVGKTIQLVRLGVARSDQHPDYTVIGVAPASFRGISTWRSTDYWVPLVQRVRDWNSGEEDPLRRTAVLAIGRLKPGVPRAQARTVIATLGTQLRDASPERAKSRDWGLVLLDSRRIMLPFAPARGVAPERLAAGLIAVSAMVLLIAAANLAGMLMARGVTRRNEVGIRLALGAGTWRTIRQSMGEATLVALAGGAVGLAVARVLVHAFNVNTPSQFGRFQFDRISLEIPLDVRVLGFTLLLCLVVGVTIGLVPALQASRTEVLPVLSGVAATPARVRSRLRYWIVIPQVCLSLVLLLEAGTLVRPLVKAQAVEPGYDADAVVFVDFDRPSPGQVRRMNNPPPAFFDDRARFYRRILDRATALPDVEAAALIMFGLPIQPSGTWIIRREDFAKGQHQWVASATVSAGYFKAMGIRLLRGRLFDERDRASTPPVAVICEALARRLWPGQSPIGQYLAQHWPDSKFPPEWLEVVGVVNAVSAPMSQGGATPYIYVPFEQQKRPYAITILARGRGRPGDVLKQLRDAVTAADVDAQILGARTMSEAIAGILYPMRMSAAILALSGLLGLLLASVGLYGVVSYSVAQRLREMGIRVALGACRTDIVRLVLAEGARVAIVSLVLGLALSVAVQRIASSLIVALPKTDLFIFLVVPLLLAAVILVACYAPARRASRVNPIDVLAAL